MEPALSVVIPIRNRSGIRAENCLRSLRWQDLEEPVEIVLSDFGSDATHAAALDALAREYSARVVRTDTTDVWNRSRALNAGIRASRAPAVLNTDIDMIFEETFLRTVLRRLREGIHTGLVVSYALDLPERPDVLVTQRDFPALRAMARLRKAGNFKRPHTTGTGACQAASRAWFERARGYDEQYLFWGMEDGDMVSRALAAGLELRWIHEETRMLHQWHPTLRRARRLLYYRNMVRFVLTRRTITKNDERWGLAPPP